VVDNDAEGSAGKVLHNFSSSEKIKLKYFIQPEKNISLARNMSVKNASGKYICFIDDDETADENWISNMINFLLKFDADGAFGYVEPFFDKAIPDYLQKREYYFSPLGETGAKARAYFTTNAIIKSELLLSEKVVFYPEFGLTGGEDVHLFERLYRRGARYINCKEAVSYEFIPKERGTLKYIYKRAYQGGQSFIRRQLEYNKGFNYKLLILVKASIIVCLSIILFIVVVFSKRIRVLSIIKFGASAGKIRALSGIHKIIY
jgi:glycosyltransferase involved in cell wall biosynthesis